MGVAKWKEIVDAVHAAGGKIFCQIAHGGRAAHPMCNDGKAGVARHRSLSPIDAGRTSTRPGKSNRTWNPQRNLPTRRPVNSSKPFGRRLKAVKVAGFDG